MKTTLRLLIGLSMLMAVAQGCGKAHSDMTRAEAIPSPMSGYRCFVIYDSDGKAVGGNCVKD